MATTTATEPDSDPREPLDRLFRDLRTKPAGLSGREAARRLVVHGPNELTRHRRRDWPKQLLRQFTHPLALLLALAAVLAVVAGTTALGIAIVAVIVLNAGLAFVQVLQNVFGTAVRPAAHLAVLATFPVVVWGVDELWRWYRRTRS